MNILEKILSYRIVFKIATGFTLAEVLITLSIIGIIAALTIPTLIQNTQDNEFKVAWKKDFSLLSQVSQTLANENTSFINLFKDHDHFRDAFLNNMHFIKKCNDGAPTGVDGCWVSHWYKLSGDEFTDYNLSGWSRGILSDGTSMAFLLGDDSCNWSMNIPNGNSCGEIIIDVNGAKNPNKIGKDIYTVIISSDGKVVPAGTNGDWTMNGGSGNTWNVCDLKINALSSGWRCSADYLIEN